MTVMESARRIIGLIDELGYALCARCKSRLEDETRVLCPACAEMVDAEEEARRLELDE
jgi:Zn finger protein HypA/HybF involved in hydrogenase expression